YAEAFADDPDIVVPGVVAVGEQVLVTEWLESPHSMAHVIRHGSRAERDHYGRVFVTFLFDGPTRTGMLHADPHPGNFRVMPDADGSPGRIGVLDFGAVARLPERGLPSAMGRLIRLALDNGADELADGLRAEGFIKDRIRVEPEQVLDYLAPFVEPAREETFTFTRAWMREQFERINNPRSPSFMVATKLNLPTSYLLIHRTWLGGLGVMSQLECEAPFRAIMEQHLPGFAS
ncbi:MAG: AarF/UbiB family protein, partial [Nocardioides sp.]